MSRQIQTPSLDEAGQSLVEFALVTLFVILPVTFGIIDGAVLFYKWVVVNNGAREGARIGAIYHYEGTAPAVGSWEDVRIVDEAREQAIQDAVDGTVVPLVTIGWDNQEDWEITYDPPDRCVLPGPKGCEGYDVYRNGALVTLEIAHHHRPFVGLVLGLREIGLTARAKMRIEPGLPVLQP